MNIKTRLQHNLYQGLSLFALPLIILLELFKSLKNKNYKIMLKQRLGGFSQQTTKPTIWLHAVSLGETNCALALIRQLKPLYPKHHFLLTYVTDSARRKALSELDSSSHCRIPYDIPFCLKRFIKHNQINALIILEKEIWPNLIIEAKKNKLPIILANATISERSQKKYLKMNNYFKHIFQQFDKIIAQTQTDKNRFQQILGDANQLCIVGNIKYDFQPSQTSIQHAKQLESNYRSLKKNIILAASTHDKEEAVVLDAFKEVIKKHPNTLLILVPRHNERYAEVANLSKQHGFKSSQFSQDPTIQSDDQVLIVDVIGQLITLYHLADAAFIGGSLEPIGGHNLVEPSVAGCPIATGIHMYNTLESVELLKKQHALTTVKHSADIASFFINLIENPTEQQNLQNKLKTTFIPSQGATKQQAEIIHQVFSLPE